MLIYALMWVLNAVHDLVYTSRTQIQVSLQDHGRMPHFIYHVYN